MKKQTKKIITDTLFDVSPYELEGQLSKVKEYIEDLIKRYGDDAFLAWDPWHSYPYDSERSPRYDLKKEREETDDEYKDRLDKERIHRSVVEARELEQLKTLIKKYKV